MIELSVVNDVNSDVSAVSPTVIKIIGCGGGGSNAVNRMIDAGVKDVEFIVVNTDLQALRVSKAQRKIAIGQKLTGGLGAGGNPAVGENAAKEDVDNIKNIVQGSDMVIITAGMGGGTGTGSAPVVANVARESGALTIAVVTTPFDFEGPVRMKNAQDGIKKLRENVDSLIIIPNSQIMKIVEKKLNFKQAFRLADDVLCQGVQGISEVITVPGDINLDFADVKSVMKNQGNAILGVGFGEGENRAVDAAQAAISNPMLEDCQIDGASKILINITGDDSLAMTEVEEITNNIKASAAPNVEIFLGLSTNTEMNGKVSVTVIATGFKSENEDDSFEEQSAKPVNENVLDYGDFERVIQGKSNFEARTAVKEDPVQKVSPVMLDKKSLDKIKETPVPQESVQESLAKALNRVSVPSSGRGLTPPPGYSRNGSDLNQPAIWRKNLDGLSRSINLSDDK
ncbi:MAG: cell division protein FtsZ [Treponema sp.]|nr:cell division protein FtsZ [Treponema sp.]